MNKLYLNEILNEKTFFPYRFKTEEEVIADYGDEWEEIFENKGAYVREFYFGDDFDVQKDKDVLDTYFDKHDRYDSWFYNSIIKDMLTLNKELPESTKLYINNITKKQTKFPYRFKTEEEFIKEYGEEFCDTLPDYGWVDDMDYLFGNDFDIATDKEYIDNIINQDGGSIDYVEGFVVTRYMLLSNINFNGLNNSKQLVYEGKSVLKYKYRFKTEKEFIDEFGNDWKFRGGTRWTIGTGMNYLFGKEIEPMYYEEFLDKNGRLNMGEHDRLDIDDWSINIRMIKEIKTEIDYNTPKQLVYENTKSDLYNIITVKCKSEDEFNKVVEFALTKGYEWSTNNSYQGPSLILLKYKKEITKLSNRTDEFINSYLDSNYLGDYIIVNGLHGLKSLYGPDYNTPKQLVYESKILKFNKYKKGE